jgi:hypothetical protein
MKNEMIIYHFCLSFYSSQQIFVQKKIFYTFNFLLFHITIITDNNQNQDNITLEEG